jgi:hypothetical protein
VCGFIGSRSTAHQRDRQAILDLYRGARIELLGRGAAVFESGRLIPHVAGDRGVRVRRRGDAHVSDNVWFYEVTADGVRRRGTSVVRTSR